MAKAKYGEMKSRSKLMTKYEKPKALSVMISGENNENNAENKKASK